MVHLIDCPVDINSKSLSYTGKPMSPINFLYEPTKAPAIYLSVSPIYPSNAKTTQKNVIFEKPQPSKNRNLQKNRPQNRLRCKSFNFPQLTNKKYSHLLLTWILIFNSINLLNEFGALFYVRVLVQRYYRPPNQSGYR